MDDSKIKYRSRIAYFVVAFIFGSVGIQKLYARRTGEFILWLILALFFLGCDLPNLMGFFAFVDGLIVACKSEEKFLIYCNKKEFKKLSKEDRIPYAQSLLKKNESTTDAGQVVQTVLKQVQNEPAIKVPGEEKNEAETHNHIKPDEKLAAYVEKSQDKMDRFQSNNYFPSVDSSKIYDRKPRSEKLKELKEELKSGLISKEEYNEELKKI